MDYARDFDYRLNNLFNAMESAEYEFAMREAVLYETNSLTISNITVLNESIVDKVKEFFENLPKMVESACNKFIEIFTIRLASDNKIFDKYDDILSKDCKLGKVNLYEYNIDLLKQNMPDFNYESIKDKLTSEEEAQKALFPNYFKDNSEMKFNSFTDRVKYILRGSPSGDEVPSKELTTEDFTKIKEFVKNFKTTVDKIKTDRKTVLRQIINLKNFIKQKETETSTQESYYSYLFGRNVLLEEENTTDSNDNNDNQPASGTVNKDNQENNSDNAKDKAADKIVDSDNKKSGSLAEEFKKARLALKIYTQFFSAKMSIASAIHKEYRNLINEHIKSYGKNANDAEEKEDKSENENNDTNDSKATNEDEQAKELLKKTALEPDGSVKDLNEDEKAELRVGLKKICKKDKGKADSIFNNVMKMMKNKKKK